MKSFIDVAKIEVKAGDGGNGASSFRREKFVPKGGPDGGMGGDGGNVYARSTTDLTTLYDFTHQHKFVAPNGENGKDAQKTGKSGEDIYLEVPVGTIIYELTDPETPQTKLTKIADLDHEETVLVAKGGIGGRGNVAFKSSTHQAPTEYEEGTFGEHRMIVLELKLVADVGLIGLPNAGKSTLLSRLTAARPEIADYPFTTLSPNLGVMEYYEKRIVLADIPGLIEGAAEGKGLGDDFLRHVERTRILVHLVDPLYEDPVQSYQVIRKELEDYAVSLLKKPEIVVINKIDVTEVKASFSEIKEEFKKKLGVEVLGISAVTGEGLNALQDKINEVLEQTPVDNETEEIVAQSIPVFGIEDVRHIKKVRTKEETKKNKK